MINERQIFHEVLDLKGEARDAYLEDLQSRDPSLFDRILKLLEANEQDSFLAESPLQSPDLRGTGAFPWDPEAVESERIGQRLGDYLLEQEIATGGIGKIYRARQLSLNRPVAIKVLRSGQLASAAEIQRFRAEAEAVASLDHPHIIPVYDVGEASGHHFFSMKLIEGPNLAEVMEDLCKAPRKGVQLLIQVARAVHHAHQRGVLHRDLKPSNILLEAGVTPYVADFGIAKRLDLSQDETRDDLIMGTPAYMAPEQVSSSVGRVTARTDVYAIGCILYEILTGRRPFEMTSLPAAFQSILKSPPRRPASIREGVPRDLETICLKCLKKEPWSRYDSAAELADDLERWLTHQPIRARKAGLSERLLLLWHRKPVVTTLVAIVIFLVMILAVGATLASLELRRHLERVMQAESTAKERLRASLLAQASATRLTGLAGRQAQSLNLLQQAAAISKGPDLRNEALAVLALTDLDVEQEWELEARDFTIYAFSPAGDRYARGFQDGRLEILSFPPGQRPLLTLPGRGDAVWVARFNRDNRLLIAKYMHSPGSTGPGTVLWNLEDQSILWQTQSETPGSAVEFHPTLPQALIGTRDAKLMVVDCRTGRTVASIDLPAPATALDIRPDGKAVAIGFQDLPRTIVYALPGFRVLEEYIGSSNVGDVAWSHDGELLAIVYFDKTGEIWEFSSGRHLASLRGHQGEIVYADFLPTGPVLKTYSWDETTRLWDPYSGDQLLVSDRRGYRFSEDGRRLFFLTSETFGYWSVHHGEILRRAYGHRNKDPRFVSVSPNGKFLVSTGAEKQQIVWDAQTLSRVGEIDESARFLDFASRGKAFYACEARGMMRHSYQIAEGKFVFSKGTLLSPFPCYRGAVDPAERFAVSFEFEGSKLRVVNLQSREAKQLDLNWPRESLHVSPDGKLAASGNWRGSGIRIWDLESGKVLRDLIPESIAARTTFSHDGKWLASASNREYMLWRVENWEPVASFKRPLDYSNLPGKVDFSPDDRLLAVAKNEGLIALLAVPGLQPMAELEPPGYQEFTDLRFSPDGARLYATTSSNQIQVWDLSVAQARLRELELED